MARTGRNRLGFTLVELMIVLVIIGIIAAFAIPSMLEAQKTGHESGAEKALRMIVDEEAAFYKTDYDQATAPGKNFSYNLANLRNTVDAAGNPINLIDSVLASGTKEGYDYGTIGTYNAAGGSDPKYGFAYYAVPTAYPDSGRKTFVISHEGIIYYKDQGNNTPPATWPDPANDATWVKLAN